MLDKFKRYMKYLCEPLVNGDRHSGFSDYSRGLMLLIERKSVEPLAAHTDLWRVSAKHQSLHHLVSKSQWSDQTVLTRVREGVMAWVRLGRGCCWVVDGRGFPEKGAAS